MEYITETFFSAPFWSNTFLGNELAAYVVAVITFVVALAVLKLIQLVILGRLQTLAKKTKTDLDDLIIEIFDAFKPSFYVVVSLYLGLRSLVLLPLELKVLNVVLLIWVVYQVIVMAQVVIDYAVRKRLASDAGAENAARLFAGITKFVLWAIGILLVLQNAGVNVTSLIAGLGIGGVAIAFALQKILEDLFSSFAIYFDKPFEIGDVIKVDEMTGEVKRVGVKTTRLQSPEGQEIIISNRELTNSRVENFGRIQERRALLKFGVLYETDEKTFRRIPAMVREVVEEVDGVTFQRAHFTGFGDSSLDFRATYHVISEEYEVFLDKQQEVNFALKERFAKEGIDMAYPTRTVYIEKG